MRLDHIVIHIDNDLARLHAMKNALTNLGYPFDPQSARGNNEFKSTNLNIGNEYLEIVRLLKPNVQTWMPAWTRSYESGMRGAFCVFLEVENIEKDASHLTDFGVRLRGPARLAYSSMMGILRQEAPYTIYYLPPFPDSPLQLALMQYLPRGRETTLAGLKPNSIDYGISGIRRAEIELPNMEEGMDLLLKIFPDLRIDNGSWYTQLDKQRLVFSQSPDQKTRLRLTTVATQRNVVGGSFRIDNVEVNTVGG